VLDVRIDDGHNVPMRNEGVARALRQRFFKPALVDDTPVAVWVAVPIKFSVRAI
jgi:hypothetical protein